MLKSNQVKLYITASEIWANSNKFKTHRDYIAHLFEQKGFEVTRWQHTYSPVGDRLEIGLEYARTDSDVDPGVEIVGTIGVNIRPKGE